MDELAAEARRALPGARLRRPGLRRVLRAADADRRDHRAPARVAAGAPRGAGRRALDRRSAGDPVGVRLVAGARRAAGLVRARRPALEAFRRAHPKGAGAAARPAVPTAGRSSGRSSITPGWRSHAPTSPWRAVRDPRRRSPATPSAGPRSRPSSSGRAASSIGCRRHHAAAPRTASRARPRAGPSALRAPYVDTLSVVQLELLRTLRQRRGR